MNEAFYENVRDDAETLSLERHNLNFNNYAHFHRNIELHYVTDGNYRCFINGGEFSLNKDDICFISSCNIHSAPPCDAASFLLIIPESYGSDIAPYFKNNTLSANLTDKEFNRKYILPLIENFYGAPEQLSSPLTAKGFINCVFGILFSHYPMKPNKPDGNCSAAVRIIQYIEKHYTEKLTLDSLAKTFGYNKYYFSKLFNRTINKNFNEYINYIRTVNFIKKFAADETQNVTDLIFACGFDSTATFYRNFKEIYGVPPQKYFSRK